jgi:glucokinase
MRIIAGDVGGTKTLLQLVEINGADSSIVVESRFESGRYATFDLLLRDFAGAFTQPVDSACFAVAGPVLDERAEVTNLGWVMQSHALAESFGIRRVALINDFYAVALGVPLLAQKDLISLNAGRRVQGAPIGILGAGTGLGEAFVTFDGERWSVIPSEGGHGDFGPQDEEQSRLFLDLHKRYGHVSWERVCSGMGLVNIFTFVGGDPAATAGQIAELASSGDAKAVHAFEIFVDIYGAEAGNMALRVLARGGVFLAGGIAAKNVKHFTGGRFLAAFLRKGRFAELLSEMPVDLIVNEKVGLIGATEMARRMLTHGHA